MSITREQVEELGRIAEDAKRAHRAARQEFAVQECPLKLGETVTACGYTHIGKSMIIEGIRPAKFDWLGDWEVSGCIVKANGEKGLARTGFNQRQWEEFK